MDTRLSQQVRSKARRSVFPVSAQHHLEAPASTAGRKPAWKAEVCRAQIILRNVFKLERCTAQAQDQGPFPNIHCLPPDRTGNWKLKVVWFFKITFVTISACLRTRLTKEPITKNCSLWLACAPWRVLA